MSFLDSVTRKLFRSVETGWQTVDINAALMAASAEPHQKINRWLWILLIITGGSDSRR